VKRIFTNLLLALALVAGLNYTAHPDRTALRDLILPYGGPGFLSPTALAPSPDGRRLYIACATANQVAFYDVKQHEIVRSIDLPGSPSGLALSSDARTLYVSCAAAKSWIVVIDSASGKIRGRFSAGHTAMCPVLSPDGQELYVCNRFNNSVEVFDAQTGKVLGSVEVDREPVAAALSPDGRLLFVANLLHSGRADVGVVAAAVSVIDTAERKLIKHIPLTNGSTLLRGLCVSPDGKYVAVTHGLGRFHLPTTTVAHGWMNNSALSLIDVAELKLLTTVLLDEDRHGAANPWATQWSADAKLLCVTQAGTHDVSLIDAPGLLAKIKALPLRLEHPAAAIHDVDCAHVLSDVPSDLGFLKGIRTRVPLQGKGPRCLAVSGNAIFVGNYFSDSLSVLIPTCSTRHTATIQLQNPLGLIPVRKGELYFNDATLSYQGWQSCASCHSSDGRVDGLDWDLLNDGMGNPKNVKSLVFCFQTPPVMSLGVRADAAAAIRAGMRSILFTTPREEVASAIDEYVKTLQPIPSPYLIHNGLSTAAQHGRRLFRSRQLDCIHCHAPPLLTDLKPHSVGTGKFDQPGDQVYTPALVELWRTAPYLHDGSAASLRDVVVNHGFKTAPAKVQLTATDIDDLVAYLQTL
jgi:YVTN family beta-propeller protein